MLLTIQRVLYLSQLIRVSADFGCTCWLSPTSNCWNPPCFGGCLSSLFLCCCIVHVVSMLHNNYFLSLMGEPFLVSKSTYFSLFIFVLYFLPSVTCLSCFGLFLAIWTCFFCCKLFVLLFVYFGFSFASLFHSASSVAHLFSVGDGIFSVSSCYDLLSLRRFSQFDTRLG